MSPFLLEPGFLNRGPLYADLVLLAVLAALGLFIIGALAARSGRHRLHGILMTISFTAVLAVAALLIVHRFTNTSPSKFSSGLPPVLIVHISGAMSAIGLGSIALVTGFRHSWKRSIGLSSTGALHRTLGRLTLIVLTVAAFTGGWVYLDLYQQPVSTKTTDTWIGGSP